MQYCNRYTMLRFSPKDRNYIEWEIENNPTDKIILDPILNKLLPGDMLNEKGEKLNSPYMEQNYIPGVLITSGKTYGRPQKTNKTNKLYYRCIPYDKTLPCVLIPFEYKLTGLQKNKTNIYILFKLKEWQNKHPEGTQHQTLGNVDDPEVLYNYQIN